MAIVKAPRLGRTLFMPAEIEIFLAGIGVEYQRWPRVSPIPADAPAEDVLKLYQPELQAIQKKCDFMGCEVLSFSSETAGLKTVLSEFKKEHWHADEECRFILAGRAVCYIHPQGNVVAIELEPGDLISIARGVRHWMDVCTDVPFRTIEFVSKPERRSTTYTRTAIESEYESVYLSPAYVMRGLPRLRPS